MSAATLKGNTMRTPKKSGRGRPPLPADELKDSTVRVRMPSALAEKFFSLGGADWLRRKLDQAKVRS